MGRLTEVRYAINAEIRRNGSRRITGTILNGILNEMLNALGKYYQFAGVAHPDSSRENTDENIFYLAAEAGTYADFGALSLADGEVAALVYSREWMKMTIPVASDATIQAIKADIKKIEESIVSLDNSFKKKVGEIEESIMSLGKSVDGQIRDVEGSVSALEESVNGKIKNVADSVVDLEKSVNEQIADLDKDIKQETSERKSDIQRMEDLVEKAFAMIEVLKQSQFFKNNQLDYMYLDFAVLG